MDLNTTDSPDLPLSSRYLFSKEIDIVLNIIYVVVTLSNFTTNGFLWFALYSRKSIRTTLTPYIVNISICDFLGGVVIYPYVFSNFIVKKTLMNQSKLIQMVVCSFTDGVSLFFIVGGVSLATLCIISYRRSQIICKTFVNLSSRVAKFNCLQAWLVVLSFIFPAIISYEYSPKFGGSCTRSWGRINGTAYRIVLGLFSVICPTVFLSLTWIVIKVTTKELDGVLGSTGKERRKQTMRQARRMIEKLEIVFIICWMPFLIYWILATFSKSFPSNYKGQLMKLQWSKVALLFALLQGSINPFLYSLANTDLLSLVKRTSIRGESCRVYNLSRNYLEMSQRKTVGSIQPPGAVRIASIRRIEEN